MPDLSHTGSAISSDHFRLWRAFIAACLATMLLAAFEAVCAPDSVEAAAWWDPISLVMAVLWNVVPLTLVMVMNHQIIVRLLPIMRSTRWRHPGISVLWCAYLALIPYGIFRFANLRGVPEAVLFIIGLAVATLLSYHRRPLLPFLFSAVCILAVFPYLQLRPLPRLSPDAPIVWVAESNDPLPGAPLSIHWQGKTVYLQWRGTTTRLTGISPAFAVRNGELITLEGRDLVITPISGRQRRISLYPRIPDYVAVLTIQPYPDGVMLNLFDNTGRGQHVVHVVFATCAITLVPDARRVCCSMKTDRYIVIPNHLWPHEVRDARNRLVRRHGMYPTRIQEWDADPARDLFGMVAIGGQFFLIAHDGITMSGMQTPVKIASVTLQPNVQQVWIAEATNNMNIVPAPASRLFIYTYSGRLLGTRSINGRNVSHAMPIEESMAQFLLDKYGK